MSDHDLLAVERGAFTLGDLRNIVTTTRDWNAAAAVVLYQAAASTTLTITDNHQENTP